MELKDRKVLELLPQVLENKTESVKVAAELGKFIRDRLREVSFARKIIPPDPVTRADCQISVNHDTLVKIVFLEPQSRAMTVSFRGQPRTRFIRAPRVEVGFFTISSEVFKKHEQELLVYDIPLTKIVEDNSLKDIQEIEDREFLIHVEAAVQAMQTENNGGVATALNASNVQAGSVVEYSIRKGEQARAAASNTATPLPITRPDIVNLFKMLDGRRLKGDIFLITEPDFDDILQWTVEDFGDRIQSETAVEGYKYNTVLGKKYCRTIKTDILRPGNVYAFTSHEFLGRMFLLNSTKFYIDKIANLIQWQAWEDIAMAIVNIASVVKLETYSADANPDTNADSLLSSFIPKDEDDLGAMNNKVDKGLNFPKIVHF